MVLKTLSDKLRNVGPRIVEEEPRILKATTSEHNSTTVQRSPVSPSIASNNTDGASGLPENFRYGRFEYDTQLNHRLNFATKTLPESVAWTIIGHPPGETLSIELRQAN